MATGITINDRYDELMIELVGDRLLPHPTIPGEVICLPQGMQLRWKHKVMAPAGQGCSACGGMLNTQYYSDAVVGDCKDERFPVILAIPAVWIVETSERRLPAVCTLYSTDRRGMDINTLIPPHLRDGIKW